MLRQLESYGHANFGNYVVSGAHGVKGWKHGGDETDTYSCIYFVEFHSQPRSSPSSPGPALRSDGGSSIVCLELQTVGL